MASQFNPPSCFCRISPEKPSSSEGEEQETELSLCLSLGGIYSKEEVPLLRSSSVAAGDRRRKDSPELSLSRTCSLPASPPEKVAAWATASAAKSVALGRAIGRIKTQNCLKTQGHEVGSATRAEASLRPRQAAAEDRKKTKGEVRSWREVRGRMPSVTTMGEGPNGKRVEGFLYKYNKGGHVSIVCVCHGSFLTPAEFVRHAGGLDDRNPMRRIHVTHMPLPF